MNNIFIHIYIQNNMNLNNILANNILYFEHKSVILM